MSNFADRLIDAIRRTGNPSVVGLDPRLEQMPEFVLERVRANENPAAVGVAIATFHEHVIAAVADVVPAVKLQIAFYEQYGLPGLQAFADTIALARDAGLVVIADAKRNDVDSTAQAYANAFLGRAPVLGREATAFESDALTVSPFLGRDSLAPFADACAAHGKGLFVLVKTSNPGSRDVQDQRTADGETISQRLARMVDELGEPLVGAHGYSAIGAVVGATFPAEAQALRELMPRAIVLVPGYGAQGGTADDATASFDADGLGAIVNASRSITYAYGGADVTAEELRARVRAAAVAMAEDLSGALARRVAS